MGTQKKKITASSVLFALAAAMFCVAYAGVALCVLWLGVVTHQPAGYKPLGTVTILGLFGLLICFLFTGSPLAAARATHRKLNAMGEIRRRLDAIEASLRACDRGGEKSTDATPADGNHGDPAAGEESTG